MSFDNKYCVPLKLSGLALLSSYSIRISRDIRVRLVALTEIVFDISALTDNKYSCNSLNVYLPDNSGFSPSFGVFFYSFSGYIDKTCQIIIVAENSIFGDIMTRVYTLSR